MISIKNITFKNFKLFGPELFQINFSGSSLTILGGPNGFGKTSVFDAIELALTGNISRLVPLENRQNPSDVVVANNNSSEVEIILELSGTENVKIARRLKNPTPKDAKKISKFQDLWELFELIDSQWVKSSNDRIDKLIGTQNFSRDYHLFHYIQQEEAARFLKSKNEVERAEELSQLFGGTLEIERNLSSLVLANKRFDVIKGTYERRLFELGKLEKPASKDELETITYKQLLTWLAPEQIPYWDTAETGAISENEFNRALSELSVIKSFVEHRDIFIRNRSLLAASKRRDILDSYMSYYYSIPDLNRYEEINLRYRVIQKSLDVLQSKSLQKISNSNIEELFAELRLGNWQEFSFSLTELMMLTNLNAQSENRYAEILETRTGLRDHINGNPNQQDCLLCGSMYVDHSSLIAAIDNQTELLLNILSDQEKRIIQLREAFIEDFLDPLIELLSEEISECYWPSNKEIEGLKTAASIKDRLDKLHDWLLSQNIEVIDIVCKSLPGAEHTENKVGLMEELVTRIEASRTQLTDDYVNTDVDGVYDRIYRDYFNSDSKILLTANIEEIIQKSAYIRIQHFNKSIEASQEINTLREKKGKLEILKRHNLEVIKKIKSKIKQFRKRLITDIEIPFYIYSGKILQSHQDGDSQGIFIKDPTGVDELKNVRFVANWSSDHDVLNTMSSGQISATVIALTLALNKVYCKVFSPLLIDDPVQTMDDINMSSLVELLRNEFKDRQIILSTHEEKTSRYFTYKYKKYNLPTINVSLMNRRQYSL
jgi:DNA repair exonuclease SbcCD ATPase subunit